MATVSLKRSVGLLYDDFSTGRGDEMSMDPLAFSPRYAKRCRMGGMDSEQISAAMNHPLAQPTAPHHVVNNGTPFRTTPLHGGFNGSPSVQEPFLNSSPTPLLPLKRSADYSLHFRPEEPFDSADFERHLSKRKRMKSPQRSELGSGMHSPGHHSMMATIQFQPPQPPVQPMQTSSHQHPGKTYSAEDVRQILDSAVKEREDQLIEQFTKVLQEKLAEQFENFSKFNEDYISRALKESQYDYMS